MNSHYHIPVAQRGAALVVALIMLLLLTIIGLTSIRGTSLQENMASNLRESSLSLQAAEAALRKGEELVSDKFLDGSLFDDLDFGDILNGDYGSFEGVAASPKYRITLLTILQTDTSEYAPEGALVRVEGEGSGLTRRSDNSPTTKTQLRSTFLVEE